MNERIIFSILENGSDNDGIGALVSYFLLAALFGYVVLALRYRFKKEQLAIGGFREKSRIRAFFAKNAIAITMLLCLAGAGLTYVVWNQYRSDRELILNGNFQSISGTLSEYSVSELRRNVRSRYAAITGAQPSVRERDKIIVNGRMFVVHCEKPGEAAPTSIGSGGTCLQLYPGQKLRIDYAQIDPTHYRSEPLRIWITQ